MMSHLISDCFCTDIWEWDISELYISLRYHLILNCFSTDIQVSDIRLSSISVWYHTRYNFISTYKKKMGIELWYFSYRTACMQHTSNAYTTFNAPVSRVVRGVRLKVQAITRIHQATTSWHILLYTPDVVHIKLGTWICNAKVIQHIIMQVSIPVK